MASIYLKSTIGGYMFDVNFKEEYSFENVITQNPVQNGSQVNDHAYRQPAVFTFDVGVSDCLVDLLPPDSPYSFSGSESRSAKAFQALLDMARMQTVVAVVLNLNGAVFSWPNTVTRACKITRDKATHNAIRATVTLQEIIIAQAATMGIEQTASPPDANSSDPHVTDQTIAGQKTLTDADKNKSWWQKIVDAAKDEVVSAVGGRSGQ